MESRPRLWGDNPGAGGAGVLKCGEQVTSLPIAGKMGPFSPEGRKKNCAPSSSPHWGEGARREAVGREVPSP
jgi:hypothetical protein